MKIKKLEELSTEEIRNDLKKNCSIAAKLITFSECLVVVIISIAIFVGVFSMFKYMGEEENADNTSNVEYTEQYNSNIIESNEESNSIEDKKEDVEDKKETEDKKDVQVEDKNEEEQSTNLLEDIADFLKSISTFVWFIGIIILAESAKKVLKYIAKTGMPFDIKVVYGVEKITRTFTICSIITLSISYLAIAFIFLAISKIFKYGYFLQKESDETL